MTFNANKQNIFLSNLETKKKKKRNLKNVYNSGNTES